MVDVIAIREITVDNSADLERFYASLDPETRCLRFCASRGLTDAQAAFFCRRDGMLHEGLVATQRVEGAERIVGHLCVEQQSAYVAEVAVVVAEAVQHHHVGRRLVEAGVQWARGAGFRTLTATMLVGNEPIHRLLTTLGLPATCQMLGAGTCRVDVDLAAPEPQIDRRTIGIASTNPTITVMP